MTVKRRYVPVYLPNRTEVGQAEIDVAAGIATIKIQSDSSLMKLLEEDLVGLSVVYFGAIPETTQEENATEGEETNGR